MDDEYEEEEILFYMDFDSKIGSGESLIDKQLKIVGIDTEEPILQLGSQVFKGEWKDAMGTCVFFDRDPAYTIIGDPLFCEIPSEGMLKFVCKTDKVLHMSRIFVKPKSTAGAGGAESGGGGESGGGSSETKAQPQQSEIQKTDSQEQAGYKTEDRMECDDLEATTGDLNNGQENITSSYDTNIIEEINKLSTSIVDDTTISS